MSFFDAAMVQPLWVKIWLLWLMPVLVLAPLILLVSRSTRRAGLFTIIAHIPVFIIVPEMYDQMGYVRLLGLPHLIFWIPLVIYLILRVYRGTPIETPYRQVLYVLIGTLLICLAFDAQDVVRYLLGETDPLT
jgi:hypothetical protein